jgi:hypothetical protein
MFKAKIVGYKYHTTSVTNSNKSIQLPVVMVKSWSNPLTVRLNKAAKPNKSKDIGRVVIK